MGGENNRKGELREMNAKKTVAEMDWDDIEPIIVDYPAFGKSQEDDLEAEIRAEKEALAEVERGICLAELDFEEDSDFALRTRPQVM